MIGFEKETICMGIDEAKDYVEAKVRLLMVAKDDLIVEMDDIKREIDDINARISHELEKLEMLDNPPSKQKQLGCCCDCEDIGYPDIHVVARPVF